MKRVAKLVIRDDEGTCLMLWRSDHPTFPNDPDLSGGIVESDESLQDALLREAHEEIGLSLGTRDIHEVYRGKRYSDHGTEYVLYMAKLSDRPVIDLSWEHSSYKWLPLREFINRAKHAEDTFMHMAGDVISKQEG